MNKREMLELTARVQMDLRDANAKLVELRAWIAASDLSDDERPTCPECGLSFRGSRGLAEHLYVAHDGPEPPHYVAAEAAAADDVGELDLDAELAGPVGEAWMRPDAQEPTA